MKIIELEAFGSKKCIRIEKMKAMEGWEIQRRFVEFAMSTDKTFRRAYTLEVLRFATVLNDGIELPLSTDALIDNHLGGWENLMSLFEEVLRFNGIDPDTHADKLDYWSKAGGEMAVAFIAEASKLIEPALSTISNPLRRD